MGDGTNPYAGLVQGPDGNFYGTLRYTGVFEISPDGSTYQQIYNFSGSSDGNQPVAGMLFGADGYLYGVTSLGDTNNSGNIFKLFPPVPSPVTFSQWETNYGISSPPADSLQVDDTPNLLKYFCNIDPTVSMSPAVRTRLPTVGLDTTSTPGTTYLTLTFHQYGAETGVTPSIQSSPDLNTWTTVPNSTFLKAADYITGDSILQAKLPVMSAKQFIRLELSLP